MVKIDPEKSILLRGATENNLNNVTLNVPVGLLTCVTGVSGSGKSTLVDDCLVAEATRRHRVLSRTTRRIPAPYSPRLTEARVPFVVCVRQGIIQWNSRSTVATATGLLQRLRDVIVRHSEVRAGGKPLGPLHAETIAEWCIAHHGKSSARVLAVIERRVLGSVRPYIEKAAQLVRDVPITFSVVETGTPPSVTGEPASKFQRLVTKTQRDVYAILGEPVSVKRADDLVARIRLAMSVAKSPDDVGLSFPGSDVVLLTGCLLHPSDPRVFWVPSHSLLSFNSQLPRSGRCLRCDGTGVVEEIAENGLIADPKLPLAGGGVCIPYESKTARYKYFPPLAEEIRGLLATHALSINSSWRDLKDGIRTELLLGSGERIIQPLNPTGGPRGKRKPFVGLIERVRSKLAGGDSSANAVLAKLRLSGPCLDCDGTRLNHAARSIYFSGLSFPDILNQSLGEATEWLEKSARMVMDKLSSETLSSLSALCSAGKRLGLGHLSLGRSLPTLSGGECQRLRIVKALLEVQESTMGNTLHQLFVMDEPAAGLHPTDVDKLNTALHRVVTNGVNTIVMVEHNLSIIRLADWVIDVGPLSADQGGQVMFVGSVEELLRAGPSESPTRLALQGKLPASKPRRVRSQHEMPQHYVQSSLEAIGAFRDYLANAVGESDPDKGEVPASPAYLISTGGDDTHASYDVSALLGLSLPLFRVFASESSVDNQVVFADDDSACAAAIDALLLNSERRVAWYPATTIATQSTVTWEDIRSAIKLGIAAGTTEWFDGKSIVQKSPPATFPLEGIQHLRIVVPQGIPEEEAVHRAFALGEGWLSVIDPRTSQLLDFSTRVLDHRHLRTGARWTVPQIFDSGIAQTACLLCKGGGTVEGVNEMLVIADKKASIRHDRLLTKHALEVLRAARRRQMFPVIDRLAKSGLMTLDIALSAMRSDLLNSFWFGYPDKSFLSVGGEANRKGDWYQWLGVANYVIEHMWKSSDRGWANELHASRQQQQCPRCGGTGLGWEARMRVVNGITLQSVLSDWTVNRLSEWLDQITPQTDEGRSAVQDAKIKVKTAIKFGLGSLKCGARYPTLSSQEKFRTTALSAMWNQLLGSTTYVRPPTDVNGDVKSLLVALRKGGTMKWILETNSARNSAPTA